MWTPMLVIGWPGPGELLIIFAIVLLLFGGSKLPQVARSMGQAMRAFKEEAHKLKSEIELEAEPQTPKPKETAPSGTSPSSTPKEPVAQAQGPSTGRAETAEQKGSG